MHELVPKRCACLGQMSVQCRKGNVVLLTNCLLVGVVEVNLTNKRSITLGGKFEGVGYAVVKVETLVALFGVVAYCLYLPHCSITPV